MNGRLGIVDIVEGGSTNHERGDVNHLLSNSDMSLSDENTSMMNGLGFVLLEDNGLQSTLHELFKSQTKNEIKFSLIWLKETKFD